MGSVNAFRRQIRRVSQKSHLSDNANSSREHDASVWTQRA